MKNSFFRFSGKTEKGEGGFMKKLFFGMLVCSLILKLSFAEDYLGNLGTYLITADKEIWQVSRGIEVISEAEIEESGAENLIEILKFNTDLVTSDWLGNSSKASVDYLGFGETASSNMLLLIDGRRVNEIDLSGIDFLQIPVERIKRVEIIKGGYSSLYGDNATGGVINIITKKDFNKKFYLDFGAGSFSLKKAKLYLSNKGKMVDYSVSASVFDTDGYRKNNTFHRKDFGVVLKRKKGTLSIGFHQDRYGLPGALWEDQLTDRTGSNSLDDRGKTQNYYIDLNYRTNILNSMVSFRNKNLISVFPDYNNKYKYLYPQINIKETLQTKFIIFGKENLFNLSGEYFFADSNTKVINTLTDKEKNTSTVSKNSFAFFLDNRFFITDNFILNFAFRNEKAKFSLESSTYSSQSVNRAERFDEINSYDVGFSFKLNQNSNVYVSFSKGFRFPNVDEFKTWDMVNFVPNGINKNLSLQKSLGFNMGLRTKIVKDISGSIDFYSAKIKDEIFYNPLTFANENYPETSHQGFNLNFIINPLSWLNIKAGYSFTKAVLSKDYSFNYTDSSTWATVSGTYNKGNYIPGVPRNKVTLNLNITPEKNINFNLTSVYLSKRFFISDWNNEGKFLSSFSTLDFNFTYKIRVFNVYISVRNIFDRHYSEYGTYSARYSGWTFLGYDYAYYPLPGRTFSGGISLSF